MNPVALPAQLNAGLTLVSRVLVLLRVVLLHCSACIGVLVWA